MTKMLVAFGSTRGGTEGLAVMLAHTLSKHGVDAEARPAASVTALNGYDGVVVAGALYAAKWHKDARRFVRKHKDELRSMPTWLVSSGPLDHSADDGSVPPVKRVDRLAEQVGARGTQTFGGCLAPDAHGFIASSMAKQHAGDFRSRDQIERFAHTVVEVVAPGRWVSV